MNILIIVVVLIIVGIVFVVRKCLASQEELDFEQTMELSFGDNIKDENPVKLENPFKKEQKKKNLNINNKKEIDIDLYKRIQHPQELLDVVIFGGVEQKTVLEERNTNYVKSKGEIIIKERDTLNA